MSDIELIHRMFNFIESACIADGGDGDVLVVSPNYMNLADEFGRWCEMNNNTWWTRNDQNGSIWYNNNQESIHFSDTEIKCWATTTVKTYLGYKC